MEYVALGDSGLDISRLTLGTMTWGEQNTAQDAFSQIDLALEHGINLIDVAEMYPGPPRPETQGDTERILGQWLARSGRRDKVLIATKVVGPINDPTRPSHFRDGNTHFDRANLTAALDASLKRLGTDYVDLYQLHWPDRNANYFGKLGYPYQDDAPDSAPIEETLAVLKEFIAAGKVRHIGVSNETPWGVGRFLEAARHADLPRIVSIQNPYSLLNRSYEIGLSEFAHRDGIGLLAYSPLAFGVLSGKYLNGARPAGGRLTLFDRFVRYSNPQAEAATAQYVALADAHGLTPAQLALAWVNSRPFVLSNIIGATTLAQLEENLRSIDVTLDATLLAGIEAIHTRQPNPAP